MLSHHVRTRQVAFFLTKLNFKTTHTRLTKAQANPNGIRLRVEKECILAVDASASEIYERL